MELSEYRIYLDIHQTHSGKSLDVKKTDTGRRILISLMDGGFTYNITSECFAVLNGVKPDGAILFKRCAIQDNTIIYEIDEATTNTIGIFECEIRLYGANDKVITSPGFDIVVNDSSYDPSVAPTSEVDALTHLISEATTVITEGKQLMQDMTDETEALAAKVDAAAASANKASVASSRATLAETNAAASATEADNKAKLAITYAGNAETAAANADQSADRAATMMEAASQAQTAAGSYATQAAASAESASGSATTANSAATRANTMATRANTAREEAVKAASAASNGADLAATHAANAEAAAQRAEEAAEGAGNGSGSGQGGSNTPFVTPQMYGAKGDGVTDDTEAFQKALAENDSVFVPTGNYLISDTLDISYKKSLVSDDGQKATILYNGSDSVVSLGRLSVFRNINITVLKAFSGTIFDTNNYDKKSGETGLGSRVEHVNVDFEVDSPNATLIGITVDSGTDANNIPKLTGVCFQTYKDIHVDNSSCAYGNGIKMEVIQGRAFTEATKTGFPWINHIAYDDISLGHPHTAIKATATNTSGSALFERVSIGHVLCNNVFTQFLDAASTPIFLELDHFGGYFTKCIGWDYHSLTWAGEKVNKIGEGVSLCLSDCEMSFGDPLLKTCEFTAETEHSVEENPEYFLTKYFGGTILSEGYDAIDAKIDAKLTGEFVANVAEEKINDVLYSGYTNVLDDPLTQIKSGYRFSGTSLDFQEYPYITAVVLPIVKGGNIIRWSPSEFELTTDYPSVLVCNSDDCSDAVRFVNTWQDIWTDDGAGGYLTISNPTGYKYAILPFFRYSSHTDFTVDTEFSRDKVIVTINREITGNEGQSYTEYLQENVIGPSVNNALEKAKENGEFDGEDGYTPVRGTDYWTEADKAEIKSYVDTAILGGAW